MKNLSLVVNTNSSCFDLWEMFFTQLEKHFPNNKIYVFTDKKEGLPDGTIPIIYNTEDDFRTQYLKSIKKVKEDYVIYLNEDYILYDLVNISEINRCYNFLMNNTEYSFIRFAKGFEFNEPEIDKNIYQLNNRFPYFFSQTAGIWRRKDLENIHENTIESGIANKGILPMFEVIASETCRKLDIKGCYYHSNENKRGMYHYDSNIFPYIATAIIKGMWNVSEYENELLPLLSEYNINYTKRGTV